MSLPMKALRYGQFKVKTTGETVPPSGHEVLQVEFTDADGQLKTGFYKPLAADYPPLLAKYSVAAGIAMRLSLGDRAAEDRLVFDDSGKNIVGTISIAVPGYKPLLSSGSTVPVDVQEKEQVCPSVETLLQENAAELLIASWYRKCDDRHPGNFSLAGLIDWDMLLYNITHILKGGRYIDGILKPIPQKAMGLRASDLDNFPNIEGRTHWPANTRPGNFNYYKHHLAAESFKSLAANPALETNDGPVSFQEQMFSALLKELLTFDPEVLRARLQEYFGDMTLDYQSLETSKREALEAQYPQLFNKEANGKSFVDHMMAVFQREYDELRSTVVLYMGCESNSFGVPVTSFASFLRNKPSAFKKISDWVDMQSAKMEENWNKNKERILKPEENAAKLIPGANFVAPEGRFNKAKMKQRYHKFWRDAHAPMLGAILDDAKLLANDLANTLRSDRPISLAQSVLQMPKNEGEITEAWMLLGDPDGISESKTTDCEPNNEQRRGLIILEKFIADLHRRSDLYFKLKDEQLTPENNCSFIADVERILQECESNLYRALGNEGSSVWAREFTKIAQDLQQLTGGLNFERHLRSKDQKLHADMQHDFVALYKRKHTDKNVVISCLNALFDWADSLESGVLDDYIRTIIKDCYEASPYNFTAKRSRGTQVREYLKSTTEPSGANRLAAILSTGGCANTSLNTQLIATLIPQMLQDTNQVDVNLLSVRSACMREQLDKLLYTQKAREFVLGNERFAHVYAKINMEHFNNRMYSWISNLPRKDFKILVEDALKLYEPFSFNWFSGKVRGPKVRGYLDDERGLSNEKVLAFIFAEGGLETNSLNTILFEKILALMKTEILADSNIPKDASSQIVLNAEISPVPPCPILSSLEVYAKPRTFEQKPIAGLKRSRDHESCTV
ncbi:hypothetical protein BN59_00458 [Legionella massiliensis]|uniref:Uncharacterized protein n=1 Tax=Legionella massiliensis TaxID=1034943 RepID=A0A078KTA5_9GAMM|nr:hypothetical protein [Legionella massiliensis]CDZ76192.1 hypothetical protein BN59_00458 [Legionella massiliensis]CEE11930.1 hypothetical protein BN1094_00458 [Legionella massiliensis]